MQAEDALNRQETYDSGLPGNLSQFADAKTHRQHLSTIPESLEEGDLCRCDDHVRRQFIGMIVADTSFGNNKVATARFCSSG